MEEANKLATSERVLVQLQMQTEKADIATEVQRSSVAEFHLAQGW